MRETIDYIRMFARFPFALRRFLQHTLTLEQARQIVQERLEQREENFLYMLENNIYGHPRSPYLPLLKMAGCEFGDVRALVKQKGLEGALRELRQAGVYVTFEEFKGRHPIVRNGMTLQVSPRDWDNPHGRRDFATESGASTGAPVEVHQNLDRLVQQTPNRLLTLATWGVLDAPVVYWRGIFPDSTISGVLQDNLIGNGPTLWFSNLGLRESRSWKKYDSATYYMLAWMRLYGLHSPLPRYVPPDEARRVVASLNNVLEAKEKCLLRTSVSRALRVCLAAEEAGISLAGLTISGGGEPITAAKMDTIQRAGVHFIANYALSEVGTLGNGCAQPIEHGDIHLFTDVGALITHPHPMPNLGLTLPAFNLTTLLPAASKILLNLEMDDYGIIEERLCGCELGSFGYTTHLRQIRSYSKLVGEGVTLIGNEMIHVLEHVLPTRFGGNPLDYQLVEEEDGKGFTRVYLVIDPRIEITDEQAVIGLVLDALRRSSPMADAARAVWQQAGALKIKRGKPFLTTRGKWLPLHLVHSENSK